MQLVKSTLDEPSTTSEGKFAKAINGGIFQTEEEIATKPYYVQSELSTNSAEEEILAWKKIQACALGDPGKAALHAKKATARAPISHCDQESKSSYLRNILAWRYERTGALEDLQQAIFQAEEALDATPHDHPDWTEWLRNLGNWLGRRFERTGAMDDLESAISQCTKAVESTPRGHPCRASRLGSLGNWLARRRGRTGSIEDLERAILLVEEAVDITPCNHPNRAAYITGLGNMLALKYQHTGNLLDILLAVFFVENAVASTPVNTPERANWLSNLGTILAWKYEQTRALDDLQCAILRVEEALEAMPHDYPNRAASLSSLGDLLYCRYDLSQTTKDCDGNKAMDYKNCLSCYKDSWNCGNAPSVVRIRAAYKAARILLNLRKWEESSALLYHAVYLLPSISPCHLKQQDQQHMLKEFAGLATLAASTNLLRKKGPIEALQLLEIGRGVIAQLRFGSRTDLATLRKRHPEMAEKFERFQRLLDSPNSSSSPILAEETGMVMQLSKKSKHFAAVQFDNVVDEIRQLPDLRHFLLPPTENELKAAASGGPVVVINVSTLRCDALLLETGGIRSIPLPNLHHKDVVQNTELLKSARGWSKGSFGAKSHTLQILEWLWDAVAGPILEELGIREPPRDQWPHVWWIPTGLLSSLPLHAAGRHRSKSLETVIDRVVSSYSPSIKALLYTQRQSMSLNHVLKEVLLVSMETTPGCAPIGKARDEITAVEELLPALALKKKLEKPCKGDVVDGLRRCNIFHFAGHGMPDSVDPSKSRLLLRDWQETPLTVEDLIDLNRHDNPPFLAYLSACSTGASPADRLHDESINLMTACQLAGFRHTVGSLWDVYDRYSVDAAREFYKALGGGGAIDDKAVAWGVHSAARHIRECTRDGGLSADREGDVFAWAPYIHMGP